MPHLTTEKISEALSKERLLITGGAGFIGTSIARAVAPYAEEVVLLDSMHPDVHGENPRRPEIPDVSFVCGDVTSLRAWQVLLAECAPTAVIHLAAETGTGLSLSQATRHGHVNVVGTTTMLDAFYHASRHPDHIVLTSSRAVYGEGRWMVNEHAFYPETRTHVDLLNQRWTPSNALSGRSVPAPVPSRADTTEPRPTNIYAATKLAQEHILTAWTAATGTALSILRLQNVYGPGQSLINSYTGVLALFARLAVSRQQIDLYEDGGAIRDFVFIDDVTQALVETVAVTPKRARLLDIGSGVPTTLTEVAELMAAREKAPAPVVSGKFREGDVRAAYCDISDAKTEIGYEPAYDLNDGVGQLLAWVKRELEQK